METHTLQLKKKRDQERFEQAKLDIDGLIKQSEAGKIELAYVNEAGFAPQPLNRSAWTKTGEVHAVTANRAQRMSIIGAMLSSGNLALAKLWKNVSGLWFFGFLMALIEQVGKPKA
ncbi:MAG: hypothetical protein NTV43_14105 [Methylococcales bacterium]|nr:hypothetical protein [Methylococcales bacterium]